MKNAFFRLFMLVSWVVAGHNVLHAQMKVGNATLYGNEWIDYTATYYKIKISEDGLYKIPESLLASAGFITPNMDVNKIALFKNGSQVPIYVSPDFGQTDGYLVFYGERNTIALDTFLYDNWKEQLLNPDYSLFTDTSNYFLVYQPGLENAARFSTAFPDYTNNNLIPASYYWHEVQRSFHSFHYKPVINSDNYRHSSFYRSEGFVKKFSTLSLDTFAVSNLYTADTTLRARLSLNISTNNNNTNVKTILFNNAILGVDNASNGKIARPNYDLKLSSLNAENYVTVQNSQNAENHGLASVKLVYPRIPDMENVDYAVIHSTDKYFRFKGLSDAFDFILDRKSKLLFKTNKTADGVEVLVNLAGAKELIADNDIREIDKITPKKFTNIKGENHSYLIISSKKMFATKGGDTDNIQKYVEYKSSADGGSFNVGLLYDEEIYDQFGYGLVNHPWSFKNLSHYLQLHWPALEYVFIIGKGREYPYIRTGEQLRNTANETYFIPAFGIAPSDVMLFSTGKSMKTKFAIGRLSAKNMEEVGYYLDKIKVHDEVVRDGNAEWTKNIMHLGGGANISEKNDIKTLLSEMEAIIRAPMYGANVKTFYKDNAAEVQIANLDGIYKFINEGTSIINFFGHAAVGSFDFSLDIPQNYNNQGRLPFIFSLGCYSGNICSFGTGVSEQFILAKDKGAVGFVAASGSASLHSQGQYGIQFYRELAGNMYGNSVGNILKKLCADLDATLNGNYESISNYLEVTLHQQLVLHGDPSVRFSSFNVPDYSFDVNKSKTLPALITIEKDSFTFTTTVKNAGKAVEDSISVTFSHFGPSNELITQLSLRIPAPFHSTELSVKFPIIGHNLLGENSITGTVDAGFEVDEFNENNNDILSQDGKKAYVFFILSNDIRALHPCEFSIVNKTEKLTLTASSVNPFSASNDYIFQMDTTEQFNSPLLKEYQVSNAPTYVSWSPEGVLLNNITYYWRVARKADANPTWSNSSFTYIEDSPSGWTQQHYYQFLKNKNVGIIPQPDKSFKYDKLTYLLSMRSHRYIDEVNVPFTVLGGEKYASLTPFRGNVDALNVVVWYDKGIYKNKTRTDFGSTSYSNNIFCFDITSENGRKGVRLLLDELPDSAYVFMFTYIKSDQSTYNISKWENDVNTVGYTLFNTLSSYGAKEFEQFRTKGPLPYIYFFRKNTSIRSENIGVNIYDQVNYSTSVVSSNFKSTMSNTIGPASKWTSFDLSLEQVAPPDSAASVTIYKINNQNQRTLHLSTVSTFKDLSDIDASVYPFIELEYNTFDLVNYDPTALYKWKVLYDGNPDIYLLKDADFVYKDTLDQGEPFVFPLLIGTDSPGEIDSVHVRLQIINAENERIELQKTIIKLNNDRLQKVEFNLDTRPLKGLYQLVATVNYDSLYREKAFFNNTGVQNIFIKPDLINPVMDVTFDGIRILDGDVVSPNPAIQMAVKDENKYLLLDQKNIFKLRLKNEKTGAVQEIDVNDANLQYDFAQSANNNKATITYSPQLEDGEYSLLARAEDVSGNASGNLEYAVRFNVVSKKEISNLVNYPNPFSTSTSFVFDLSGGVPENIRITIMTMSGKVVREITGDELGPLHMGKNITRFKWNGTDEFGSRLANGVYLYTIRTSDKEFEINNKFASDNFGKLVIIR
ncbi:MAG: hypothetical protein IPN29_03685 [Saprospiraceae bacterium]|nr:hypothetical protein [Saprospiraceae bacterium]